MNPLRQLNDHILHQSVPDTNLETQMEDIKSQLMIMQQHLDASGFIGLAANQCEEFDDPCNMMIIGTNSEEFRTLAAVRYPGQTIPHQTLMINPKILRLYGEHRYAETGEGCGSIEGLLRGKVKRFTSVDVEFHDLNAVKHQETHHDLAALILQHEYEHLGGIVYLQKILTEMTVDQLSSLIEKCHAILDNQQYRMNIPWDKTKRAVTFDRDPVGNLVIHENHLIEGLRSCLPSALQGMVVVAQRERYLKAG